MIYMNKNFIANFIKNASRNEMTLETVLDIISKEAYKHAGRGFTVEVNAEVTNYKIKKSVMWTSFWAENTDVKYINSFHIGKEQRNKVDLDISISKELENKLPLGITITKTTPVVLYDTRDYRKRRYYKDEIIHKDNIPKYNEGDYVELDNPEIVEGRRVYLTITDECASKILGKAYVAEYLFRNRLLIKYAHILKDIALRLNLSNHHTFDIQCDGVYYCYNFGDCGYDVMKVLFEEFEMENLSSYTQLYGMALAILEILEKEPDCIGSEINCTISNEPQDHRYLSEKDRKIDVIYVWYDRRVKSVPPQPPQKELKSW